MIKPVPGLPIEGQPESWVLRAVVWAEARGESSVGKLAVAWVIGNRAKNRGSTIKAEVLRPWQFSSFNHSDPNRSKLQTAHETDPDGWAACDAVCELFEKNSTLDPTLGASHYYVLTMPHPPVWGRGHKDWQETVVLGAHVFGKTA